MEKSKDTWTVLSSEYLHRAPWLTVRKDHVVLPNGNHIPSYYILEYPNWVNTIAITRNGQFVFIRQYRHGIQETSYELCAGVCEEEDGSPMVSAQRELLEETGYGNGVWIKPVAIPSSNTHYFTREQGTGRKTGTLSRLYKPMKHLIRHIILLCGLPLLLAGCMEWDYGDAVEDFNATGAGLFITNEGNFQYGNATLSYYDP